MSEGRVYPCRWSMGPEGVHLWLKGSTELSAHGETWHEAEQRLTGLICTATGDGEPVLSYTPPPVLASDLCFLSPPLMLIRGGGYTGTKDRQMGHYEGQCEHCGHATGQRKEKLITLYGIDEQLAQVPQEWWFFANPVFASTRFRALLTAEEQACCEWRPIERSTRSRLKYFEVIPHIFVPPVAIKGREIQGWYCPACDRRVFSQHGEDNRIAQFVARKVLPTPLPPLFGFGDATSYELVLSRDRALVIAEDSASRGAMMDVLGVLNEPDIDPSPPLPLYDPKWRRP